MHRMMLLAGGAMLLAGCAATPADQTRYASENAAAQQRLDARLAGYHPSGQPMDCIPHFAAQHSDTFDNAVVYYTSNQKLYVNHFGGQSCNTRHGDDILVETSYSGNLCSGTIVHLVARGSDQPDGTCVLGEFTPYSKGAAK